MALSHRGWLGGRISGRSLEVGVCATAASGFLLFGYDQGVMSGIITEPLFLRQFPQMDPSNKEGAIQAMVVAIYEIGCLIGSFFIIGFGDKLGRRRAVLVGTLIMLIGTAIQASSFGLAQLIVGRIVTGVGNGMNTSSIPVWQSEMAPPKIRGFLVLFEGALISGGVMVSYWLNYGFWFVDQNSFQWRFPIAFQAFFGILLIFGVLLFPESPRWLLKHGKEDVAVEILANLNSTTVDDKELQKDLAEMIKINEITSGKKLTFKEFFSNGPEMNGWRACIALTSQAFQQIGGINLVTYYATTVFENSLGFSQELSRLMTGCLGTEYFLAAVIALFVVDRLGRRRLMIWGAIGMGICLLIIGACLSQSSENYRAPAYVATVFIFVYNTCFAIGWLGVTWLYPAEVTPIRIRAEANGLSTSANWIFNYAVVQLSPIMINTISWKTYFVFMCFNFAFVPVVYFTFVETNGYKLETMDAIFAEAHSKGENPVWTERRVRKGGELDVEKREGKAAQEEGGLYKRRTGDMEKDGVEHREDA
ncbi:general substrate transporter [Saccharata proteae CBS 121410]|uniref:General substrate transporter n=1 Tax=Saccharata proteae CBS 121410 TaxID=1314787 RepID=A0A9P4LT09_9PEZI|nr:general substrate transporter [Saccharata proteae CBS 121410]